MTMPDLLTDARKVLEALARIEFLSTGHLDYLSDAITAQRTLVAALEKAEPRGGAEKIEDAGRWLYGYLQGNDDRPELFRAAAEYLYGQFAHPPLGVSVPDSALRRALKEAEGSILSTYAAEAIRNRAITIEVEAAAFAARPK